MITKISHLTSVHPRYDTRIFIKQCSSLAKLKTYRVNLVVADGNGAEINNNVNIYDVGKLNSRVKRIFKTTYMVLKKAIQLDSDIYHLHDPELIPVGLLLKKRGKKVIFDSHEDFPKQLLNKPYLNRTLLRIISKFFSISEKICCKKFDFIFTATPSIKEKFLSINKNSIDINNYPIIGELSTNTQWENKNDEVCFVGSISSIRGIKELTQALMKAPIIRLNLAGSFNDKNFENEVKKSKGWSQVNELGHLNRKKVQEVFSKSKAGIVTFHPVLNHIDAQPNKMFEYMSAGIPVIASDFPLWRKIIIANKCGICVNPRNPNEITNAINFIIENPTEAMKMGKNGRSAVLKKFNWAIEEEKLLKAYQKLTK